MSEEKLGSLEGLMSDHEVGVLVETWWKSGRELNIPNFNLFRVNRNYSSNSAAIKKGGGVAIFLKSCFGGKIFNSNLNVDSRIESLVVTFKTSCLPFSVSCFAIVAIYIPPQFVSILSNEITMYLVELVNKLKCKFVNPGIFICGDFNHWQYSEFVNSTKFKQLVSFPTFFNAKSHKLSNLDLLFTNLSQYYNDPVPLPPIKSTLKNRIHACISLSPLPSLSCCKVKKLVQCRSAASNVAREFCSHLGEIDVDFDRFNELSIHDKVSELDDLLISVFNSVSAPFSKLVNKSDPIWMNSNIKRLLRMKKQIKKRRVNCFEIQSLLKLEIAKSQRSIREKFREKIPDMNSSEWYKLIRKVCGLSVTSVIDKIKHVDRSYFNSSDFDLACTVNCHFSKICNTYESCDRLLLCPVSEMSQPMKVGASDVIKILSKLRIKKSNSPGLVPTILLKSAKEFISPLLANIISQSFESFTVPNSWKIGYVTPLAKKAKVVSLNDLRSITQTDIFFKVAEQFMFDKLYTQLESKINPNQYGCLWKASTAHYLVKMSHFVLKTDEIPGANAIVCGIDSFKAFDLVNHRIVFSLLLEYGVEECDVLWLISFLSRRKQIKVQFKVNKLLNSKR